MIPKKLHYCWFGGGTKPDLVLHCLRSWTETCSDYEIVEWNEGNFDVRSSPVAEHAYRIRKFAFVSDVVRARVLHEQGGIYLDSDVEIHRNLDRFLTHEAFTGFETTGMSFTALWGSMPGHRFAKLVLDYYDRTDPQRAVSAPNTVFVTQIMKDEFGVDIERDELQACRDGLVVYPSNFFCLSLPDHYATHHFAGSWAAQKDPKNWSQVILAQFYSEAFRRIMRQGVNPGLLDPGKGPLSAADAEQLRWYSSQILAGQVFTSDKERLRWHLSQILETVGYYGIKIQRRLRRAGRQEVPK
jgi:mannosyltransferase OCH1-like enzyme